MTRWVWLAVVAAAMLGAAALVGANYKSIVLFMVARSGPEASIGPNRDVRWSTGAWTGPTASGERPPNIVLILADDLGVNDVSTFGGGLVPTPNIDALAAGGALLSQAYAGTAACAPSRAMIMTGRYPTRHGFEFTPTPSGMGRIIRLFSNGGDRPHPVLLDVEADRALPPMDAQGLPGSEVTIAEVLKARGYRTLHIGKWHLGGGKEFGANAQGFDESLLLANGLYLPEDDPDVVNAKLDFDPIDRFLWARMRYATSFNGGPLFKPKGYLTDYYTEEAVKAIRANRDRPFFLYLAHWGVHTPMQATKADYDALGHIGDHRRRVYGAMIRALDRSVGRVVAALEAEGLSENTLIVFSSDNGGAGYIGIPEVNQPYRGWKLTFFEGGIRVPTFMVWPGRITPGTRVEHPVSHLDMLPTLAAAAGAEPPADRPIDGVNLLPSLSGTPRPEALERPLFWQDGHYLAVRQGGWKLQTSQRPRKDWLYDLENDPTERTNLAAARPEKVAELKALLAAHRAHGRPALYPYAAEVPVMVDKTLEEKATAADE
jgi:arylsulfatase A-like enzyme